MENKYKTYRKADDYMMNIAGWSLRGIRGSRGQAKTNTANRDSRKEIRVEDVIESMGLSEVAVSMVELDELVTEEAEHKFRVLEQLQGIKQDLRGVGLDELASVTLEAKLNVLQAYIIETWELKA